LENIIGVIKLKRTGWAGHVSRIGDIRSAYKSDIGVCYSRVQLRIILTWMLKKQGKRKWIRFSGLRTGASDGIL
jgi:hypothetical protein